MIAVGGLYAAISAVAAAISVGSAQSPITFGADLGTPAVVAPSCSGFGDSSCTAFSMIPTSYAPTSGLITAVHVRTTDAPQGPMQVLVMRSYYQNNLADPGHPNYFCCFVQEYGPVFTPAPGTVTTVPTNLGVVEQPTPAPNDGNTVAKGDFIALSILDGTTPIPLGASTGAAAVYYAPAPQSSEVPAPSPQPIGGGRGLGTAGYVLLLSADLEPLAGTGLTDTGGAHNPFPRLAQARVVRPRAVGPSAGPKLP